MQNSSSFDESITKPPSESRKHASAKPAEDVDMATVDGRDSTSCAKGGATSGVAGDKNRYLCCQQFCRISSKYFVFSTCHCQNCMQLQFGILLVHKTMSVSHVKLITDEQ